MRRLWRIRRVPLGAVLGLLAGSAVGVIAVGLTSAAVAQRTPVATQAVLEATHLPPLLTVPGERVDLTYDIHCIAAGVEDPERGCDASGSVFLRGHERAAFQEIPLQARDADGLRQLTTVVPADVAASDGFEYYAVLEPAAGGRSLVTPPGGSEAPHRVIRIADSVDVDLGAHVFGLTAHGTRVASAAWGDGLHEVGLEHGKSLGPIGASAFDVDRFGTVYVLDQAHRRLFRWGKGARAPARVPLSIEGRLADLAVAEDGSIYVLESVSRAGQRPLLRRFDEYGRELDTVETAERTPSQIRIGPEGGPVVLQHPSHQWMPIAGDGSPLASEQQRSAGKSGRPLRDGGEVVVLRRGNEVRVAVVGPAGTRRAWRVSSPRSLGEVQLAQPVGQRLLLVVRLYTDTADEFAVLLLDRKGIAHRFAVDATTWAETAPLGRFRLAGGSLFRLGSSATHAFVDRFDLEVR